MKREYTFGIVAFVLGLALAFSIAGYVNTVNDLGDDEHAGCPMMDGDHDGMHDMMNNMMGEDHFDDDHHQEMHNNMMGTS